MDKLIGIFVMMAKLTYFWSYLYEYIFLLVDGHNLI